MSTNHQPPTLSEAHVKRLAGFTFAVACAFGVALAAQGPPPGPVPTSAPNVSAEAQKHIEAARAAAGAEWQTVFEYTCNGAISLANPPAPRAGGAGRGAAAAG